MTVYGSERTPKLMPSSGIQGTEAGMMELTSDIVSPRITGIRRSSAKRAESRGKSTATASLTRPFPVRGAATVPT
jgi:hypothetical protein